jgi:choline dehydrogenase-like flavoprotein
VVLDARNFPAGKTIQCDVCVVGCGAAGMTLALEFAKANRETVVLEGGGKSWEKATQSLYEGEVSNPHIHGPIHRHRQRRLGGTTTVWGGRCIPYDDIDFEARSYVPYSGWPMKKRDLDSQYARAHDYLKIGDYTYTVHDALSGAPPDLIPGFRSPFVRTDVLERYSLPLDFGREYAGQIRKRRNVKLCLHANCINIAVAPEGYRISYLEAASLNKNVFRIEARNFVLAAGGLETTRLLLASNDIHRNGIGNHSDLLGRFYMSHLSGAVSAVKLSGDPKHIISDYERTPDGIYCRRRFWITEEGQRCHRLMNTYAFLHRPEISDPSHGSAILSAMFLAKHLQAYKIPIGYREGRMPERQLYDMIYRHAANVCLDLPGLFAFGIQWTRQRLLSRRKLPSFIFRSSTNVYPLHYHAEQSPDPQSRVLLSRNRDVLGVPRLYVDWHFSDLDVNSIKTFHRLLRKEFQRTGAGELIYNEDTIDDEIRSCCDAGGHHIGTTRMSSDPRQGVVDENCRVHGINNLYVASSSVFPTSSQANPTLTIVAIAIRVADYVNQL